MYVELEPLGAIEDRLHLQCLTVHGVDDGISPNINTKPDFRLGTLPARPAGANWVYTSAPPYRTGLEKRRGL